MKTDHKQKIIRQWAVEVLKKMIVQKIIVNIGFILLTIPTTFVFARSGAEGIVKDHKGRFKKANANLML